MQNDEPHVAAGARPGLLLMSGCPTDHELNLYHSGDLDPARMEEIRAHLTVCAECAARDSALLKEHEDLVQYVRDLGLSEDLADLMKTSSGDTAAKKPARQQIEVQAVPPAFDGTLDVGAKLPPPNLLEGYEILRELHRGGQGIVYQAVQKSTKRKVAIKVLLEGPFASKSARRRFEREVELIASLKHPNIVTVFDSGVTADGRHYCVMDYVRGQRLDQYIRSTNLCLEDALRLFVTICQAVNYAHQRGVIHRDLKPSNIIVDHEGNPKILDFGLAKQMAAGPESLVSLTGEVVGTLPYLSPEAAKGRPEEVDTRADVYALGVILYEMLTGQYPYPVVGEIIDVLKNITDTQPAPPSKVWKPGAGIDRRSDTGGTRPKGCPLDAEVATIVMKTLSKERERRYQSALELGRDIGHYLAGEPIEAKRESSWYVLRKTLGRYRAAVAVVILFALLVVGSSITLSIMYSAALDSQHEAESQAERARQQLDRALAAEALARQQLERAQIAERRAQRRFDEVRELANTFMFEIHTAISDLPGSTPARELLVQTALTYLDSLAEEASDDPELQRELAIAYGKVGDVQGSIRKASLGNTEAAAKSYAKSLQIFETLLKSAPADDRLQIGVAYALTHVADIHWAQGRTEEALSGYRRSKEMAQSTLNAKPDNDKARRLVIQGMEDEADCQLSMGRPAEALANYRAALKIAKQIVEADPTSPEARSDLAMLHDRVGGMVLRAGNPDEALVSMREALRLREAVVAEYPDSTLYREWMATVHTHIGDAHDWARRPAEALASYRRSLETWEAVAAADPRNTRAQRELAVACDRVAMAEYAMELKDAALTKLRKSLEIRRRLAEADPSNATWRGDLAASLVQIAHVQSRAGEVEAAITNARQAVTIWEALSEKDPTSADIRAGLAASHRDLGDYLKLAGQADEAIVHYCRAIDTREQLVRTDPENVEFRINLTGEYDRLGDLQLSDGRSEDAARCFRKALLLAEALAESQPNHADRRLAVAYYKVGHGDARLAEDENRPKEERLELLAEAKRSLRKSNQTFKKLRAARTLAEDEAGVVEEIEKEIGACDAMIANINAGLPATAPAGEAPAAEQEATETDRTGTDDADVPAAAEPDAPAAPTNDPE